MKLSILKKDKFIWMTFVICIIMAMVSIVPFIVVDGGYFTLCDDYNTQMIPFATALNNSLRSGEGSWQWNIGLGAQRLGGNSYYYLGSPLFYLSMILPGRFFPYLVGPFYILKYALAGMFSYMYLRKYVKNRWCAVAGAMLYAFSGFQSINLEFYIFHDVVAFFPLLMMGIDDLYENGRKSLFIFAVALCCALNYFFFFGEVLFLVIYVLFRYLSTQDKKTFVNNSCRCILCGVLGMGIVGVIFIPSAIYTFGNPRVVPDIIKMLHKNVDILVILKGIFIPAEAMNNYSIIREKCWASASCYLPVIGLTFGIAYSIKKRDWLSRLLVFCLIISFIPVAVSAFYLFTNVYYRWWYMFILIILVASVQVFDNINKYPVKIVTYVYAFVSVIYTLMFWVGDKLGIELFKVYRPKIYLLLSVIVLMSSVLSILAAHTKKYTIPVYIVVIGLMCVITTVTTIVLYRKTTHEANYKAYFAAGLSLEKCDEQYRYANSDNMLMYPGVANGTGTFNSTVSNSTRDFEEIFDYVSISTNMDSNAIDGITELLAGRYEISRDEPSYESYTITERAACPIGYYYDSYITDEELLEISLEERGYGLLRDLVLSSEDASELQEYLNHDNQYMNAANLASIEEYVGLNEGHKVEGFERIHSGFACETDAEESHVYFFSVPYDKGWRATIDDDKTTIYYSSGFMAVVIPKGQHAIVFKYRCPGIVLGFIISIISILVLIYLGYKNKGNRR